MTRSGRPHGGLADAVLGEIDVLRPQGGRTRPGAWQGDRRFSFSPRASQLWRFALGSNAAVLKKIGKGGTANAGELSSQIDYLFAKSAAIFGNAVVLDPHAMGLSPEERTGIVGTWVEGWRGSPKNGHTTHLLMSFPAHVRPEKAKLIAEAWAFEMFQSGEHQDDIWSYVAALHTDRPHPHIHIVVNNRGIAKDSWFYMAREHVFNLEVMKARMVAIAAEEGVFLDATSRAERGLLSYGPSRAEIERSREGGRAPKARPREGRALEDALATLAQSAEAMRSLQHVAALTGLPEIGARIARAEAALRKGCVVQPFPVEAVVADRADLERHFSTWMTETREKIGRVPGAAERRALQDELYGYAIDIARGLGDTRGAQLMQMLPQSALYATAIKGDQLTRGREVTDLRPGVAGRLRTGIIDKASAIGLDGERTAKRLEVGAANAWEERDWLRSDLQVLAERHRLDLRHPNESRRVTAHLQGFHDAANGLIDRALEDEALPENDRLLRTLRAMGRTMRTQGSVAFRGDAHAERFATELRQRYGEGIVTALAAGKTDGLARDVEDPEQRAWIARAIVSAAKAHEAFGLTLREAVRAERTWAVSPAREAEKDWER